MSWQIPSTRADGQPLLVSELAGYEIYYTTDSGASATFTVNGGTATAYTVSNLAAGTYYFAMSAVDTSGQKSALSAMVPVSFGQ